MFFIKTDVNAVSSRWDYNSKKKQILNRVRLVVTFISTFVFVSHNLRVSVLMQPTNVRQTEHQMGDYGNTNALQRCTHPSVKQKPSEGIEKIIYSYFVLQGKPSRSET